MNKVKTLNSQEHKLNIAVLHAELERVKSAPSHEDHKTAIAFYKRHLITVLKKLDPRGSRWL